MPSKGGVPSLLHDVGMGEAALGWQGYEQEEASCVGNGAVAVAVVAAVVMVVAAAVAVAAVARSKYRDGFEGLGR